MFSLCKPQLLNKAIGIVLALLSLNVTVAWAGGAPEPPPNRSFTFNFLPINTYNEKNYSKDTIFAACGVGNLPIGIGAKYSPDTPNNNMCTNQIDGGPSTYKDRFVHDGYYEPDGVFFIQEIDKKDSIWHQVLIDEAQGFKMEIYAVMSMGSAGLGQGKSMSAGKNANHVWPIDNNNQYITGTGTGDARRVQFRMLVEDEGLSLDMIKDKWDRKPKITQNVTGQGIDMDTLIDMSNSSYSDMNTAAIVTNNTIFEDPTLVDFYFDSRTSANANVTGGRYKISGYEDDPINPNYRYADAPDNYGKNLDWLKYWHGSSQPDYWQPGESYGYGNADGSSGDGADVGW